MRLSDGQAPVLVMQNSLKQSTLLYTSHLDAQVDGQSSVWDLIHKRMGNFYILVGAMTFKKLSMQKKNFFCKVSSTLTSNLLQNVIKTLHIKFCQPPWKPKTYHFSEIFPSLVTSRTVFETPGMHAHTCICTWRVLPQSYKSEVKCTLFSLNS